MKISRLVKSFRPMAKDEMQTLSSKNKLALDRYFQNHVDA